MCHDFNNIVDMGFLEKYFSGVIHLAKWHQQVHCGTHVIVMKLYLTQSSIVEQWTPSLPWKYTIAHFQYLSSFKYNNVQFYSSPEFLVWDSLEFDPAFGGKHTSPLVNLCQGFRPLVLSLTDGVPQPGKDGNSVNDHIQEHIRELTIPCHLLP